MTYNPFSQNPLRSRADVQRAVMELFEPLLPHFSSSGARVRLSAMSAHFDTAAAELEGFARPLWGIVPLVAGGGQFAHWDMLRRGLDNGTNPAHPDYWGDVGAIDQRQVEMAAIGYALRLARTDIWDPLDDEVKQRVAQYLLSARDKAYVNSNWKFFRILVDIGLHHCGVAVDAASHDSYLEDIDGFYMDAGWYRDGPIRSADHYIPFAFHYYGLLYSVLAGDALRGAIYRARAETFAQTVQHWYAADGAALPFGRSLTYRFAHAGFWGALAFANLEALPWGLIKGYYLRNLRWWAGQPMFERDGVLSVGYAYPNLLLSEGYNSAASPYWAMKAFLPLALPDDHPFWTAEEVMPTRGTTPVVLTEPGMVMQHLPGHSVALTSGQYYARWRGTAEKYAKFAYSTRYGFSVEANDRHFDSAACDNALAFSVDGQHFNAREECENAEIADDILCSEWQVFDSIKVTSWIIPQGLWHYRVHEVVTDKAVRICEGGFGVAKPEFKAWEETAETNLAEVRTHADVSTIVGYDGRAGGVLSPFSNTNVMFGRTLVPQLRDALAPGRHILCSAIYAGPGGDQKQLAAPPPPPSTDALRALFKARGLRVPVHAK